MVAGGMGWGRERGRKEGVREKEGERSGVFVIAL